MGAMRLLPTPLMVARYGGKVAHGWHPATVTPIVPPAIQGPRGWQLPSKYARLAQTARQGPCQHAGRCKAFASRNFCTKAQGKHAESACARNGTKIGPNRGRGETLNICTGVRGGLKVTPGP